MGIKINRADVAYDRRLTVYQEQQRGFPRLDSSYSPPDVEKAGESYERRFA